MGLVKVLMMRKWVYRNVSDDNVICRYIIWICWLDGQCDF